MNLGISEAKLFAFSDSEHLAHQIQASDLFGDWMFDLQPGVHFEEADGAVLTDQELTRSRAHIASLFQDRLTGVVEPLALVFGDEGSRGLFN